MKGIELTDYGKNKYYKMVVELGAETGPDLISDIVSDSYWLGSKAGIKNGVVIGLVCTTALVSGASMLKHHITKKKSNK